MVRRPITVARSASFAFALILALFASGCGQKQDTNGADQNTTTTETPRSEKGVTLVLKQNVTGAELSCTLSKGAKPDEDHVRWQNKTADPVTLTFVNWPFLEGQAPIVVEAGQYSPYFSVNAKKGPSNEDQGAANAPYTYTLNPDLVGTGHGPDVPTVTAED